MMVFLAAVLDLGRVFYSTISLNNAAREAPSRPPIAGLVRPARPATRPPTSSPAGCSWKSKNSAVSIAAADITDDLQHERMPEQAGSQVTVAVTGQFRLLTPLLSIVFGGPDHPDAARRQRRRSSTCDGHTATLPPLLSPSAWRTR